MSKYKLTQGLKGRTITINVDTEVRDSKMTELLESMGRWCLDNQCGKRMSYDQFFFRDQRQANLFILRWQ